MHEDLLARIRNGQEMGMLSKDPQVCELGTRILRIEAFGSLCTAPPL